MENKRPHPVETQAHPETPALRVAPLRRIETPERQRQISRPELDNTPSPMIKKKVDKAQIDSIDNLLPAETPEPTHVQPPAAAVK